MKKVLLVDDDAVILKLYQDGLVRRGFQVDTVADGVAAVRALQANQPDVVVLDLMMPKLSGVDVLKFIRSQTKLAALPVVVLSNVYLSELADEAIAIGVQKAFLKTRCSPPVLADVIGELFSGETSEQPTPQPAVSSLPVPPAALATPPPTPDIQPPSPPSAAPSSPPTTAPATRTTAIEEAVQQPAKPTGTEAFIKPRLKFLEHAPTTCAGIRKHCKAFVIAPDQVSRAERFEDFYRKVRFLTATAGFAQFHHITLLASAFEALLYDLREKPDLLTPSVLRTLTFTVDVLAELCDRARNMVAEVEFSARVLVVDDDPISNRIIVAGLLRAHIPAYSTEEPLSAVQMLQEKRYDLLLLDIEMPAMNGFELCKRVRALPGYQKTPVIYVTVHTDFEHRTKSVLSGGNDLIAKPVFPMELAVKVITHLLKCHPKPLAAGRE